ncbi:two-component system regulatory protein YycI [Litchfieldia salsa]|uniref:Two-component signal transduction system YycFG, regulatory protein YycI n=1 Tax=Litchfieldia salsa TaxID=930152 RepID=A0A1H0UD91_9BACI|nr:two-component system regulatory protein YycI [Litchfieldia salsa]SDP64272.1 Two-component signal transduction system YycFG, regulatory protein YycI [Litchfieldia salsa]
MDWSKTKTIFIITFLILDLFLALQFIEKRNRSELDVLSEASIEEQLETEEITYDELPKQPKEGTYISGKPKFFSSEDVLKMKGQEVNIDSPAILQSKLNEPIKLTGSNVTAKLQQFLKDYVLNGDSYTLWEVDQETGSIIFFQQYQNKVFYNETSNISGLLIAYVNDKNEIISYRQTMLMDFEEYDKKEILPAIKALENLFKNGHLKSGSEVTNIKLGYYPLVQLSESQILAPTWHIVVDDKIDYYVNAFEGQILEIME